MTARPKPLIIDFARRAGGANTRVLGVLSHLSPTEAGLAAVRSGPITSEASRLPITLHPLTRSKYSLFAPAALSQLVRTHGYNVLDTQNPISKLWASRVRRRSQCALVSTLNSWYPSEYARSPKGRLYHAMELWTAGATDLFVVVSNEIRKRLEAAGVRPDRIAMVPNAVDIRDEDIPSEREALRRELGLPGSARLCCAAGRLVEVKGYDFLIHAWRRLAATDTHCIIIGEGDQRRTLERLVSENGLTDTVHLLGRRDRTATLRILKACDIFVMSSRSEGTPLALLEAATLGRPIVATAVGGVPEMVTDGEHALLAEFGDADGFAERITRLLEDCDTAVRIARCAADHVRATFSVDAQVGALRQAWLRALAIRRRKKGVST